MDWLERLHKVWRVLWRALDALTVAAAGADLLAVERGVKPFSHQTEAETLAAIAFLAAEGFIRAVIPAVHEYRLSRDDPLHQALHETTEGAVVKLLEMPGLETARVGVSVYVLGRHRTSFFLRRELVRVVRVRLTGRPRPLRGIRWTKGKGVLGLCWETRDIVAAHTEPAWDPWLNCSSEQWKNSVSATVRLNLAFRDFRRMRKRYVGAIAVPIEGLAGEFLGCICADARPGTNWSDFSCGAVTDVLTDASYTLGSLISVAKRRVAPLRSGM